MTPEKTYESICTMLKAYDAAAGFGAAGEVIARPWEWEKSMFTFYAAAAAMLIDCRAQMDKKSVSAGTLAAIKRFVKTATATNNNALNGGLFEYSGKWCICDGHRLLRLKNDIDSLPHMDTRRTTPVNVDNIMNPTIKDCTAEIDLPTAAAVKAYIAKCNGLYGKENRYCFEIVPGLFLNPHFLLDALQALPGCRAYINATKGGKSEVYFKAENGDALLLPVNPTHAKAI